MKKIYFLSLNALNFIPYAYGLLRSYAGEDKSIEKNYQWAEPIYRFKPIKNILEEIENPFLLGASTYSWNVKHQEEIAKRVKERFPDCRVVFGGPHIPVQGEDYLHKHPYIDALVHGEGEIPFRGLLKEYLRDEPDLTQVPGVTFPRKGSVLSTPENPRLPKDLPLASPYLAGYFDWFFRLPYPNKIILWETNRGCPYECSYCDWGVRSENKIRLHGMDKLLEEIDYFGREKIEDLYITDSNFGLLKRDIQLAEKLVECKKKYGYPRRVRIQFAKKSNRNVLAISKLLHKGNMLWGTTLSMQSVNQEVLAAINRPSVSIEEYTAIKEQYSLEGIHTYTELILGLPLETKDSFIQGICKLFEIGIHDDIRVFELALLPNAPMNRQSVREKYGLKAKIRPLRLQDEDGISEEVELVYETGTMPQTDWAYCLLFAEAVQALHNGGYTRFLARYLQDQNLMPYKEFYQGFLDFALRTQAAGLKAFTRISRLIEDYHQDQSMPQISRVLSQPDMMEKLRSYNPKRKGWSLWGYIWLMISEDIDAFYSSLSLFLKSKGIEMSGVLQDLLKYQKEIMLTLDYDPHAGITQEYEYNWFDYFFKNKQLEQQKTVLRYGDTHMGTSLRFDIQKGDKEKYLAAAIGISYPYSKYRHFFHQSDMTEKTCCG